VNDEDRAALAEQYANAENLDARIQLHESYDAASRKWWRWVVNHYDALPDSADLLKVGCGTGYLWRDNADRVPAEWDLLLTDFSAGMAAGARETLDETCIEATVGVAAAESPPVSGRQHRRRDRKPHVVSHGPRGGSPRTSAGHADGCS